MTYHTPTSDRRLIVILLALMMATSFAASIPGSSADGHRAGSREAPPLAELVPVDSVSAIVEVPPQETLILRIDHRNASLVPLDWHDPITSLSSLHRQAVQRVEPWLQRDLAVQLDRLGGNGNKYAQLIIDCPETAWVDEIAFSVAHTPPEVLSRIGNVNVLRDNVKHLYEQDADIAYADIVERSGEDGDFTTVSYLNYTGVRHEYPRDIYYWYIAHARVFWEDPAKVSGKSFWRKAYWDEITYNTSGTLKSWLTGVTNVIEAANVSTIWIQMNSEFGYGTNPLQPVQVLLERYGSCGQYSITTAASLKVAMIPARVAIYPASDHQWNEVYIDGHWMLVDASNDVAGNSRVKEPHLIRRTNAVNFNDAGVFERGWKPYMSAMSTFRSDDVVINSIGISAPDPSFTFRESGMTERTVAEPHMYTETSTVHINVVDGDGDPIEGAYVGVYRMGHNIYDPDTPDYPHFAFANYTNATGVAAFELGLQGYCGRCDDDHYYAALIMSRHNGGTNDFYSFSVPEENQEYSFTYSVTGNAPRQEEPEWVQMTNVGPWPDGPGDFLLNLSLDVHGRQRHVHGEWSSYETFAFRTSFDHIFPADLDVMVVDSRELDDYITGGVASAYLGATDAVRLEGSAWVPHDEDIFLLLCNTDSHYTTKVVNVTVDLSAMCKPRLRVDAPVGDAELNTDLPLTINGTAWDHIPITGLLVSFDGGANWTDILANYSAEDRTFEAHLDVSHLPSNAYPVWVRAIDSAGVWTDVTLALVLDADDPVVTVREPGNDQVLPAGEDIRLELDADDNLGLEGVWARVKDLGWVEVGPSMLGGMSASVPTGDVVGETRLQVKATDVVGRTTLVQMDIVLDAINPMLELRSPEPGSETVVGPLEDLPMSGSVWDDHGVAFLKLRLDGGFWLDISDTVDGSGRFGLDLNSSEWEEGSHTVFVMVTDLAGHTHERSFTVVKDVSAPLLAVDELDPYYTDDEEVKLSGRVTDEHGVEGLWVSVDGEDEERLSLDLVGGFRLRLPSGSDSVGMHMIDIRTTDVFGNEATQNITYSVVDETDPTLTIDTPVMGATIGRGATIHVSGTAMDNVAITEMVINVGDQDSKYIFENLDPVMGQWSLGVETARKDLGQLVIQVRVEDAAGNMAAASVIVTLADRTDPEATIDLDPMEPLKLVKGKVLVVPVRFHDDVAVTKVEYRVDGWTWMPVPCEFPCETWDVEVLTHDLSANIHVLEVRVSDAAGNDVIVNTPFEVRPVPEESTISIGLIAGIVVAVVVVLVLVYFMVLRKGPVTDGPVEGPAEGEPEAEMDPVLEPEPEQEPTPEQELEPAPEPEKELEPAPEPEKELGPEPEG